MSFEDFPNVACRNVIMCDFSGEAVNRCTEHRPPFWPGVDVSEVEHPPFEVGLWCIEKRGQIQNSVVTGKFDALCYG